MNENIVFCLVYKHPLCSPYNVMFHVIKFRTSNMSGRDVMNS